MFCSFLALVLKKALEDRIVALGRTSSWPEIIADLESSRIVPRTEAVHRMPVACDAGCKARTRTDEGAILR